MKSDRKEALAAVERTKATASGYALALADCAKLYSAGKASLEDLLLAAKKATNAEHAASRARKHAK